MIANCSISTVCECHLLPWWYIASSCRRIRKVLLQLHGKTLCRIGCLWGPWLEVVDVLRLV